MRRKIALALLAIFACSATGALLAIVHIKRTTDTLRVLTQLHRVEEMRHHLVLAIRAAQSDLYTVKTSLSRDLDVITDNVLAMEEAAERCTSCHHAPAVDARIHRIHELIGEYQSAASYYITASADPERILRLKASAANAGTELLTTTEQMAAEASLHLAQRTDAAMSRFDRARGILTISIAVTLLVALVVAVKLARAMTHPVDQLVAATRAIAAGDLGFSISVPDRTELGELARHFNSMSAALRDGYASLQAEIEERRRAEARLLHDAFHDALTGLPNRALFLDRLQHVIRAAERHPDEKYAVLFLDLDRFKVINDSLGHIVGDHLLVAVGARIAGALRPGDSVARLGGDEFGVLIEGIRGTPDALQVAERIQRALSGSVEVDGHEIFATASIGIAMQSERYARPDEVLRDADIAMYQAKLGGRACVELFDAVMHGSVLERMQLEADLRRAVERCDDEFVLHYQPVIALGTGSVVGIEALVRWAHPTRGLLAAAEFVPLAEESGAIVPLGEWVLRVACEQLRLWHDRAPGLAHATLSVNFSGRQFRRQDCVDAFRRIVTEAQIDPRLLAVEVTESVIMDDVEASAAKLGRLRDLGVRIHVDDFGTGYSSLSYLHRFPITAVKIDRSFVAELPSHQESEEVIKAIVSIAESLDFDVIAEGIESEVQAGRLQELRCRYGQGHHVAEPMNAEALEAWAVRRTRSVA
jgi:diguanylate cyclase (GGDEF)-like protein